MMFVQASTKLLAINSMRRRHRIFEALQGNIFALNPLRGGAGLRTVAWFGWSPGTGSAFEGRVAAGPRMCSTRLSWPVLFWDIVRSSRITWVFDAQFATEGFFPRIFMGSWRTVTYGDILKMAEIPMKVETCRNSNFSFNKLLMFLVKLSASGSKS